MKRNHFFKHIQNYSTLGEFMIKLISYNNIFIQYFISSAKSMFKSWLYRMCTNKYLAGPGVKELKMSNENKVDETVEVAAGPENKIDQAVEVVTGSKYVQKLYKWIMRIALTMGVSFVAGAIAGGITEEDLGAILVAVPVAILTFFLSKPITK